MKRNVRNIFAGCAAAFAFMVLGTGCTFLQGSLSSTMEEERREAVGIISTPVTAFYYNGDASSNMTSCTDTLALNLSKPGRFGSEGVSANYVLKYINADGDTITVSKTITDALSIGTFNKSKDTFRLKLTPVYALLDGSSVADGVMSVTITLSGIANATTNETMEKFTKTVKIAPLYSSLSATYATSASSVQPVYFELNSSSGAVFDSLPDVEIVSNDSDADNIIGFTATYSDGKLGLVPVLASGTNLSGKNGNVYVKVSGLSVPNQTVTETTFKINLKYAVVINDTLNDSYVEDASWGVQSLDIFSMTLSNDSNELEVTLAGNFAAMNWSNRFVIMIDKDGTDDGAAKDSISEVPCTTYSFANGNADIYFWHKPLTDNKKTYASGLYAKTVSSSEWGVAETLSGNVQTEVNGQVYSIANCDSVTGGSVTYKFNLSELGIAAGDKLNIIAVSVADWDDGVYAADCAPDLSGVNSIGTSGGTAVFDFSEAAVYSVK